MEFTAAGVVLQSELLLTARQLPEIQKYLPRLERSVNFIETRRDPTNHLFLAGPAGNLLAPSYAGWKKPDGTYGMAYLAGLSITYIAALDRLIELEKLAGSPDKVRLYTQRRDDARKGLPLLTAGDGYFIRSLDPDGTRHGVFGADRHAYFEASPNHDAIAFRVVDDAQAGRILSKMLSIPGLRPHDFILPNYPSYDDMYEKPEGLWAFGTWVNGGHWSTCEARMIMAYYRLGRFEEARRSMHQWLGFAEKFRLDNPLVAFGKEVYQPGQPVNLTYDAFGPPAAFIRGLFEYLYTADGLRLIPHLPPGIQQLEQRFPIRHGRQEVYLAVAGHGPITSVRLNQRPWAAFDSNSVLLPATTLNGPLRVAIGLGDAAAPSFGPRPVRDLVRVPPPGEAFWDISAVAHSPLGNGLPLTIAADPLGGNRFVGEIKVARLHKTVLDDDQVARLAQAQPQAPDSGPSGFAAYRPEGLGRQSVSNAAGAGLAAKLKGELIVVGEREDRAFRFSGRGYLEVDPSPELTLLDRYTLEAWIRPGAIPPNGGRIIDRCTPGASDGYMMDYGYQGRLRFICEAGDLSHPVRLSTNAWHHVAATVDGQSALRLYLDGKLVAQRPGRGPTAAPSGTQLARIGAFYTRLRDAGLGESYEARHARLVVECVEVTQERIRLKASGQIPPLPPRSQLAADRSYLETADKLAEGLARVVRAYTNSNDAHKRRVLELWNRAP
jgi:hypothetical protein